MEAKKQKNNFFRHLLAGPFIYLMIVPTVIMDIFMEIYHRICFPLYRIPIVKRSDYIKIDRHKLKYLNFMEKFGCAYCGYVNGLLAYGVVIAGRTEKYFCGIKHKKYKGFVEPAHHKDFANYGDEKDYKKKYCK